MLNRLINSIKRLPLSKKYIEPFIINAIEENFYFDKNIIGKFTDSTGKVHSLYAGLRDKVKPGWRAMLNPEDQNKIPTRTELKSAFRESKRKILSFKKFLSSFGFNLHNKSILEIGCHNGLKTFQLGLENSSSVTGSDVTFFYNNQSGSVNKKETSNYLNNYRNRVLDLFNESEKKKILHKVTFIEDDISNSVLPDNTFDIITSWETLEHIIDIDSALNNMKRILKPGGIAFHEYNPFFSLNGGHSLCTLDFPWGHCRIDTTDFINYIKTFRPTELKLAQEFFLNSLNRLTINSLKHSSDKAGLKILALIPFVKKAHLSVFEGTALDETTRLYPDVEIIDLISPIVWVLHKKI